MSSETARNMNSRGLLHWTLPNLNNHFEPNWSAECIVLLGLSLVTALLAYIEPLDMPHEH